jgi:hypothetical protein
VRREAIAGVAACALTALIVAFHVQRAQDAGGFWRDEIGTIGPATAPSLQALWSALKYSTPPVLPYVAARAWVKYAGFGSSDTSLRSLGLVGGLALLAGLWLTLRGFGCRVPLLVLMLFAANGSVIRWGDSFRGYGLACLAIILTSLAIWRLIETPTMSSTLLALCASLLSVHLAFQNTALVATLCIGAVVASIKRPKSALAVLIVSLAALLSVAPYAATAFEYQALNVLPSEAFAVKTVLARLVFTSSANSLLILGAWLTFLTSALVVGLGAVVSGSGLPPPASRQAVYHSVVLVLAVPAFIVFCRVAQVQVNPWHCLMVLAVLAVTAESLIALVMAEKVSTIGRVAAVCVVALAAVPTTGRELAVRQTNLDVIARHVGVAGGPNDFIVINPWFFSLPFNWYYRGQTPWSTVPPLPPDLVHRYDLLVERTAEPDPNAAVYTSIEETLRAGNHVWMVGVVAVPRDGKIVPEPRSTRVQPQMRYSGDYVNAWTLQLGAWLSSHGVTVVPVDVGLRRTVSAYEDATLYKLSGWHQ